MPYIDQAARADLDAGLRKAETAGELNYQITRLLLEYYERNPGYRGINDVLGACQGASMEFYRRVAVNYENEKIIANGDVY